VPTAGYFTAPPGAFLDWVRAMSLEGLRAWIGEVERKLGKRTRVFLALTVIAIGIAGASLYLAIDYRNSSVSESDVQALQQKLETRIDEGGGAAAVPTAPPSEVEPAPEATPAPPGEGQGPKPQGGSKNGGSGSGGASTGPGGATGGTADSAKLQELLEQAKRKSAEAEAEQNTK
jgi:hypothetical protein